MSSTLLKKNINIYIELTIFIVSLIIILFTAINLKDYLTPKKVLGISTNAEPSEDEFWQGFLDKNPNYIPGLIENGSLEKAKQLDPNYQPDN